MRRAILSLVLAGALTATAGWAGTARADFANLDAVQRFISGYRTKPDPAHVADAARALSRLGVFRDTDNSGAYVGFLAGVIGANPGKADALVTKLLAMRAEDHWVIVRAIAYSGADEWQDLLRRFADRIPTRAVMIERYLDGQLPTLNDINYDDPSTMDKIRNFMSGGQAASGPVTLEASPEVLDNLWGYYFATAKYGALARIIRMLPWSKDRSNIDRLTVGSSAKYTLASNAVHDPRLFARLKRAAELSTTDEKPILEDIVEAVELMDIARLRREALAAIEEFKR
jgi:hypothetical protein